jgi:hypothetical protein
MTTKASITMTGASLIAAPVAKTKIGAGYS